MMLTVSELRISQLTGGIPDEVHGPSCELNRMSTTRN